MTNSPNYIILLILAFVMSCSTKKDPTVNNAAQDRMCDCFKLLDKQERGRYLTYLDGEDTWYTGKCKLTRDNGNEITYTYQNGHILQIIERYPGGPLHEEMYYDTTGRIIKRIRYYLNGHKSYEQIIGDHTYESFYENGRIQRKGGYGFTKEDIGNKYYNLDEVRLYDSVWKENGLFDSVYRYSKASITY